MLRQENNPSQYATIQELEKRYEKSRKIIYKRIKHLGFEFIRGQDGKSLVDESMLKELDSLHEYVKKHGEMQGYTPTSQVEVEVNSYDSYNTSNLAVPAPAKVNTGNGGVNSSDGIDIYSRVTTLESLLERMLGAMAMSALPQQDFLENVLSPQRALSEASERNYRLTGEQVKRILQRRSLPSGNEFEAYGFRFIKQGWSGGKRLWKVEKTFGAQRTQNGR